MKHLLIEPLESRIAPATLIINSVSLPEGNQDTTAFVFTVTLSETPTAEITVDYSTADGTASSSSDYSPKMGTLVFAAGGPKTKTITIDVTGDTEGEDDETFTVNLTNATGGATIDTATGVGTIRNDALLTVTKTDDVFEGNSGTRPITFTITLTEGPATTDVTGSYAIAEIPGGATVADNDYVPVPSAGFTFTPGGPTSTSVTVLVNGDTKQELDESFDFKVLNVVGATVANDVVRGTIKTDLLTVTQVGGPVTEGASGVSFVTYLVDLVEYGGEFPVKVSYTTVNGTATAGSDYSTTTGVLTFTNSTPQSVSVPIYGDQVAEASETFIFRASFDQSIQAPGVTVPTFSRDVTTTIVNDDLSFSIADNAATLSPTGGLAEGNGGTAQMTFKVTMTGAITAPVTIQYQTVNGTGARGATANLADPALGDFVAKAETLTFNPGETEKTISISINGDTTPELAESFTVQLFGVNAPGYTSNIARAVATGTIINDDVELGLVSLGNLPEGQSGTTNFGFRATLSAPLPGDVTFTYKTEDGTATGSGANADYVPVTNGTVTILAGQTVSSPFYIAVRGDLTKEADETFKVTLNDNQRDAIFGTPSLRSVEATILNDDPFLSIGDVTVNEGTGGTATATFVVTLTQAPATGERVEVKFSTGPSAVGVPAIDTGADRDYVPQIDQTLTFAAGETQKTITIDVVGDNRFESAQEKFTVTLSDAKLIKTTGTPTETPYTIARAVGTATILDDDTPTVSITPTLRVAENGGPATLTVSLSNPSDVPISVDYRTIDGTATFASGDYVRVNPTTLTFNPGVTTKLVSVGLINDSVNELDETFQVQLSNAKIVGGAALALGTSTSTVTIANDDRTVTIGNASLTEASAPMNFTVTLSAASSDPVTVFYTTREVGAAPFRATAGSDFTARTGSIVIASNSTTGTIAIPILADTIDEADQTFEVVITGVTNAVATGSGVGIGTILDDDAAPTVQIVPTLSTNEGSADSSANFTVSLSRASEKDVSVNYTTVAGTALAGSDFTAASGTLTIPAGQISRNIAVTIKGDSVPEPDEKFTVVLSAPVNATLGANTTSTATIVNDDIPPTLSIRDVTGQEGAGSFTFNVNLSQASTQTVTVQYTTVDSTAAAGSDYTAMSGTLTFTPGQVTRLITIPIANNDATPELDERFLVRLSNPTNATLLDAEAVGLIQNDDAAFSVQDLTIAEEGPGGTAQTAFVTVTRSGTGVASVQYRTVDGTAISTAGRDFTAKTGTLNFAANEVSKTIAIPITADSAYEFNEQFTVELFSPVDAVIARSVATVTINDNDVAPTLSSSNVIYTEGANNNLLNFTVLLSAANEREDVTLQFETIDGTAISTGVNADFNAPTGEVRFAKGETSKSIGIVTIDDARDENDETFTLRLKNATAAFAGGGSTLSVTGTIVDNDPTPTVSIVNSLTIGENESGSPSKIFTARLSAASDRTVTVQWRTDDSATGPKATANVDYTKVNATLLTFAPGVTEQTFSVAITDDLLDEDDERFDVVLENPTNATLGANARVTNTITDNDLAPVLTIGNASIVEGAAPAMLFTVSLSTPSGRALSVNYATMDGTATSSGPFADFIAQNGTLTFAPGVTSQTISIPIIDDLFREEVAVQTEDGLDFTLEAEKFTIKLDAAVNVTLGNSSAEGSIFNGADGVLGIAVTDAAVVEGATGATSKVVFQVLLSAPAVDGVSFHAATRNGTAVAGSDYAAISNAASIAGTTTQTENSVTTTTAGGTSTTIEVNVTGDSVFEATESFFLDLTGFSGDTVSGQFFTDGRLTARGTIYNDDVQFLEGGRVAQWIDVDGDLVTLRVTRGSLVGLDTATDIVGDDNKLWLQPVGDVGGRELRFLSLIRGGGFAGTSITITADQQPGFTGDTDGRVNVGEIQAAQRIGGELDWVGLDLVDVTVEGDLAKITAGDNISTRALRKLDVYSLGTRGTLANGSDVASEILGPVGTVLVRGDMAGQLKLIGQEFGVLASLTIEGALRGGTAADSGQVIVSGRLANATVGEIIGGAGARSGALLGSQTNNGSLGNVTVLGAIKGGTGLQSGLLLGTQIGHVKLGSLEGSTGEDSALIFATAGNIASLTVTDDITGSTAAGSGQVLATGSIGHVKIGSLVGAAGARSGRINAAGGNIASLTVEGSMTGGDGVNSGQVFAQVSVGHVKLGELVGGSGASSGSIFANTRSVSSVTVANSIVGGAGSTSGQIGAQVSIGTVNIGDDLRGGAGASSGAIFSPGTVGKVTIGDDVIGGAGLESGIIKGGRLTTVAIGGDVTGGAGQESGSVEGSGISSLTIGGAIVGAAGQLSGSVRFAGTAGKIIVGENAGGQSVVGGAGVGSGRIATEASLGQVILAGDIVGGAGSFSGALSVGGDLIRATLRGDIVGGTAPATGAALQNSGFLQAGKLRSAVISGDLIAGKDLGAGITNSGVIRTGRIETLIIEGNVTGTASVPALISAASTIDSSNLGIKSLFIKGNVAFADILAGYDGNVTQSFRGNLVSADAQISSLQVLGSVQGLNVIAGAAPGADGRFGDATDVLGSGFSVRDSARVISSIASVIFRGALLGNAASYGIVAQHVASVSPLAGLARGAGNDLATAVPDASDLIAPNFRAVEIAV